LQIVEDILPILFSSSEKFDSAQSDRGMDAPGRLVTEVRMDGEHKADVIVPVGASASGLVRCVESVLERSGEALHRLIVIEDQSPDESVAAVVDELASLDSRIRILRNVHKMGYVGSCNRGLSERHGDAVLLRSDYVVYPNWLRELAAVAHSEERTACVSPLSSSAGICSVSELNRELFGEAITEEEVRTACAGLPRWTLAPALGSSCIYLNGDVLDAVGLLDTSITNGCAAINQWILLAQSLGFSAKRANHVYIYRTSAEPAPESAILQFDAGASNAKEHDPQPDHQTRMFCSTLDGHLAAHAVRLQMTQKIRVAYDIRHLPREMVGTRTYAVCLAQALSEIPEIELTLLVRDPAQAHGLRGRVVTEGEWKDDVAVIHRPAQVIDPQELKLLFQSSAHVVLTYQDLIGYRVPLVFPSDAEYNQYRATSSLTLQAVQRILAYSESARGEITAEFGIPAEEIGVIPLGVEAAWFWHREKRDAGVGWRMRLPNRYFFSIATDFPHKNLPNLLDAYALFRSRWKDGEPPSLVLAGYTSSARTGFYPDLESKPLGMGLTLLGPVLRNELRVLYQNALALVFPSLYEGFGLPPLEAMAAGTPVIAMPLSSVPEVGGDSVLYPDGLSCDDLARAMESVAVNSALREELVSRGLDRVQQFRWEDTARDTVDAYRSAILHPSERSLQMRRLLRDAIIHWSEPRHPQHPVVSYSDSVNRLMQGGGRHGEGGESRVSFNESVDRVTQEPLGIRNALSALNISLHRRLRREMRRFQPGSRQRSA
jgi:glycosyltransferase involved in cell wall biosynthesis